MKATEDKAAIIQRLNEICKLKERRNRKPRNSQARQRLQLQIDQLESTLINDADGFTVDIQ